MSNDMLLFAQDIMHMGVLMVEKNDPLINAIKIMSDKKIASIIVEDKENPAQYYIIAHSDVIDFVYNNRDKSVDFNRYKAKDLMHPIDAIPPTMAIDEIISLMLNRGFKRLIVTNDKNQPIGIISQADIMTWNNKFFQQGHPILLCVMENDSGIILSQKFFRDEFSMDLLELFGGSISAITSITSEVLKKSGNLRVIEKDYYAIMLEPRDTITGIMVVTRQSLDLRRKLQLFTDRFVKEYKLDLDKRQRFHGAINVFKINTKDIFEQ